jgi:hypothetical protein
MLDINIAHALGLHMHQPPGNLALLIEASPAPASPVASLAAGTAAGFGQAQPRSAAPGEITSAAPKAYQAGSRQRRAPEAEPADQALPAADAMQRSPAGRRKAEKGGPKTGPGNRR